jgi:pimeloyl-ACP methyl ester carboxylesterase
MKDLRFWKNLSLFGFSVLALLLVGGVLHLARQKAFEYVHPERQVHSIDDTPASQGIPYEEAVLITSDGLALRAWYTPPQNSVVVLVAHAHNGARPTDMHSLFARHGYGVVSWDFRAHGESEGEVCSFGYYEVLDVEAALDFALSQPEVERVAAWGGSMGGATVIMAAARRSEIEAVVADSAFALLEDELNVMVRLEWMRPLIRFFGEREAGVRIDDVRPEDVIGQISPRPVFIIQGLSDPMIPVNTGGRLYEAAGDPRTLWSEENVGHLSMIDAFPEEYEDRIIEFLDSATLVSEE